MAEWIVEINDASWKELCDSFASGPLQENGLHLFVEHLVDTLNGLKIKVFSNEHPPPHFRVTFAGQTNCFRIIDGEPLFDTGLSKYYRKIRNWHKKNKALLVRRWNDTRPTDCPVGKIEDTARQ